LKSHNETYLITLPSLHIEGLISGSPYVELNSHSFITSSSGFTARIDYSGRGWLSGAKNSFSAVLHPTGEEKSILYTATGQWTESFVIKDVQSKDTVDECDSGALPAAALVVADIEDQEPMESRRAWHKVAEAIKEGDMETTQREKSIIENEQRELRKKEQEEGREWERKYFKRVETDAEFEKLAKTIQHVDEREKTDGSWAWSGGKN
jgi:hypothetical protein